MQRALVIQDQVFGRLRYERGLWAFIPSTGEDGFMISVAAPSTGPSEAQRDFFTRIRSKLSEFEQRARAYIESQDKLPAGIVGLSMYSVEIGDDDDVQRGRFVLEMSNNEAEIIHRVTFSGDELVECTFDD